MHPHALRRQVSPRLPKFATCGAIVNTLRVPERNRSIEISIDYVSEPDDVADELQDEPDNVSPERTDKKFKFQREPIKVDLSPSEVTAEIPSRVPPENLFKLP